MTKDLALPVVPYDNAGRTERRKKWKAKIVYHLDDPHTCHRSVRGQSSQRDSQDESQDGQSASSHDHTMDNIEGKDVVYCVVVATSKEKMSLCEATASHGPLPFLGNV